MTRRFSTSSISSPSRAQSSSSGEPSFLQSRPAAVEQPVEGVVVVGGVVVEENEPLHAGGGGDVGGVLHRAVPPADLVAVLLFAVLRVVDDEVRPFEEADVALVAGVEHVPLHRPVGSAQLPDVRLVVGGVDGHHPHLEPVAEGHGGVVQVLRGDLHVPVGEGVLSQLAELDRGLQLGDPDREVGVLHLPGQDVGEAPLAPSRRVDPEAVPLEEERFEEGESLDVVPVGVAEEEAGFEALRKLGGELLAQQARTGPAVEDEMGSGGGPELDAGGVAAVPEGRGAGGRNRPARSPESDLRTRLPGLAGARRSSGFRTRRGAGTARPSRFSGGSGPKDRRRSVAQRGSFWKSPAVRKRIRDGRATALRGASPT